MKRHANLSFFVPHLGCPHQCVFCDQRTISGEQKEPSPEEVQSVCDRYLPNNGDNTEIAFFGGSFTAIDRKIMIGLLEAAYPFVKMGRACGIRISTRPDAINEEILHILSEYSVTSIELGAQSMDDDVLLKNGRGHDSKSVINASQLIRDHGFQLGLQMMVGMYGADDAAKEAYYTASKLAELMPRTVRIYPTIVVKGTYLEYLYRTGKYRPLELEEAIEISADLISFFRHRDIDVIRIGLHYEKSLMDSMAAGPYHPAFGELCESRIYRDQMQKMIGNSTEAHFLCEPSILSKVVGQKKSNINFFNDLGIKITVKPDDFTDGLKIKLP